MVATVTIAAYVGLGGLGFSLIQGIQTRDASQILGASIVVVVLALALDGLFAVFQRVVVPGASSSRTFLPRVAAPGARPYPPPEPQAS